MMSMNGITIAARVKKQKVLKRVKANAVRHKEIVAEARRGYVEKALAAVEAKRADLESGKIVSLSFSLRPPVDKSEVYRTVIDMLENTEEKDVELTPDQYRKLMLDQWEWADDFYATNRRYSKTASDLFEGSGAGVDDDSVGGSFGSAR